MTTVPEVDQALPVRIRERWVDTRGPLFTDMYELTMCQVYVNEGIADRQSQFDYFFRSTPDYGTHQAGYCVAAGLGPFLDWLDGLAITDAHVESLRSMRSATGAQIFGDDYLEWLVEPGRFDGIEVRAVAEGRVVHPHEPIVSVTGPLGVCQLLETSLLNHFNYPTLIATKAARVVRSARGGRVLEFGMRRGPSTGVNEGIRAALIGGCVATSNVEAGIALGRQPIGTHAHALVQAYLALAGPDGDGELEAFRAMARAAPDECILLVDTVDTLSSGVPNAVRVFDELRAGGHEPVGVRLDSGDLAYLSVQTAKLLDVAGYPDVSIVLSSDLDELNIWQILTQIADEAEREGMDPQPIRNRLVYGVGTRLITSHGSGALNGVYKLVGIENAEGEWTPAIKISEEPAKIPLPGRKIAWRLYDHRDVAVTDLIGLADEDPLPTSRNVVFDPIRSGVSKVIRRDEIARIEPLHDVVFANGDGAVAIQATVDDLAARCSGDLDHLDPGVRRLVNPHRYHVSITERLHQLRVDLVTNTEA